METTSTATATYPHFDRSYGAELVLFIFACPMLFTVWSFAAACYYYNDVESGALLVKAAVYYSAAFVFALIFYGSVRAVRNTKAVVMDGGRIIRKGGGGAIAVNCADIVRVRRSNIPFVRGWMLLDTRGGNVFPLPLRVRNGHDMVDRLFSELTMRGVSISDAAPLRRRFRSDTLRYNTLQGLRDRNMQSFVGVATAAAIFNGVVAALYWGRPLLELTLWGFAGLLFQALAYFATERMHTMKLFKRFRDGGDVGDGNSGMANGGDATIVASLVNPASDVSAANAVIAGDSFARRYAVSALAMFFLVMAVGILITMPG